MKTLILFLCFVFVTPVFAQHDHQLSIYNGSGNVISYIYISRSTHPNWGEDLLGSNVMANRTTKYIDLLGHIMYDVKAVESNGESCVVNNILLDADKTVIVSDRNCWVEKD